MEKLSSLFTLAMVFVVLAGCYGWAMNIVSLADMEAWPMTGMFVLRVIGIFFAPIGAILGYV
jgi:hypothetical protein